MGKYIYLVFSLFLFTQCTFAQTDCTKHIKNYFNKNYTYLGGAASAAELAVQRRCLHAKNPIYSDIKEFEQKQNYLLGIDDNFSVRKNLIDYQEAAEILAESGDIKKSSQYIDKFNDILIKRYDKILAAKILKEQAENGLISQAHKKELFEKLDKYLFQIGKCNPDICEGWGLISMVAGAFPRCAEDSCQRNITYETLYFDLAKTTNNFPQATDTIKKLLTKDFGSPKSNGEVKAPLIMALYYTDLDAFSDEAKKLLDNASKTSKYTHQDAILLPLVTQIMLLSGEAEKLLPYTKTKYKNIAGLEATLALLSVPLGDTVRQTLRTDLEIYYELTSACDEYRVEDYQGTRVLRVGTPALLTKNPELDLFLRQRIQDAYWIDGFGGLMADKATNNYCAPSATTPEEIDPVFASAQIARDFLHEGFIDDVILLPLFAFSKIKTVFKGVKESKRNLKVVRYNDMALEAAQNTRRVEFQMERNLQSLREIPDEVSYKMAAGQDFMPGYKIGDRDLPQILDSRHGRSWRGNSPKDKADVRKIKYRDSQRYATEIIDEEEFFGRPKKNSGYNKVVERERKRFYKKANSSMRYIGFEKVDKLSKALDMQWKDLEFFMTDPELVDLLAKADSKRTDQIINRIKSLYDRYHAKIVSDGHNNYIFAYMTRYNNRNVNIADIHLVEEVVEKNSYIRDFFGYSRETKPKFLSDGWHFSPKSPSQTLEGYTKLLGCTPQNPCYALITDNRAVVRIFSNDQSKMIRVAPHEYTPPTEMHFHLYEIGDDYSVNHRFILDKNDPVNNIANRTPEYLRNLLLPYDEIINSPLIRISFR